MVPQSSHRAVIASVQLTLYRQSVGLTQASAKVSIECEYEVMYAVYRMVTFPMTLSDH